MMYMGGHPARSARLPPRFWRRGRVPHLRGVRGVRASDARLSRCGATAPPARSARVCAGVARASCPWRTRPRWPCHASSCGSRNGQREGGGKQGLPPRWLSRFPPTEMQGLMAANVAATQRRRMDADGCRSERQHADDVLCPDVAEGNSEPMPLGQRPYGGHSARDVVSGGRNAAPVLFAVERGLGLEGSPLEKERLLMTTDWQANQFGVASQLPTDR
jgi:hypothetical protein